jgi:transcription termination/antitermination protein NusG
MSLESSTTMSSQQPATTGLRVPPPRCSAAVEPAELAWFAVQTRSNHERVAVERLLRRGMHAYLPTYSARSRRRDRVRILDLPLFPGYFFVRCRALTVDRVDVLRAPGVVRVLGSSDGPSIVPDWQIDSVRSALGGERTIEVLWSLFPGRRVRVVGGALSGVEGVVVNEPDGRRRVIVSFELLGRSVAIELARELVEPVL